MRRKKIQKVDENRLRMDTDEAVDGVRNRINKANKPVTSSGETRQAKRGLVRQLALASANPDQDPADWEGAISLTDEQVASKELFVLRTSENVIVVCLLFLDP